MYQTTPDDHASGRGLLTLKGDIHFSFENMLPMAASALPAMVANAAGHPKAQRTMAPVNDFPPLDVSAVVAAPKSFALRPQGNELNGVRSVTSKLVKWGDTQICIVSRTPRCPLHSCDGFAALFSGPMYPE